ncbi:MAG: hypothetical protein ACE5JO_09655 [Candidatus Binatia bacterium]
MATGLKAIEFRNVGFRLFNGKTLPSDPNLEVRQGETWSFWWTVSAARSKKLCGSFYEKRG